MPSTKNDPLAADVATPTDSNGTPTVASPRSGRRRTPAQPKQTTKNKTAKTAKTPTPIDSQTPLADVEAQIVAKLSKTAKYRNDPSLITHALIVKTFPKLVKLVDAGNLKYYAAARWGSAHNNDWISDALIARVRRSVKNA